MDYQIIWMYEFVVLDRLNKKLSGLEGRMIAEKKKKTDFRIIKELCIGCGICVNTCPMKILRIENNICVITDTSKCLECGTCIRECLNDAIVIQGVKLSKDLGKDEQKVFPKRRLIAENKGTAKKFTTILEYLTDLAQVLNPSQVFQHGGINITSLNEFELEGEKCFCRLYHAEKLEKIGISRMNFYGSMVAEVMVITPRPEYDIPYYIMDWDESDEHVFLYAISCRVMI